MKLREQYGSRIRLVFKNFPLGNHAQAFKAAEAGQCAQEQGRFWPFHDLLFDKQRDGLAVDQLKLHAASVGLDQAQFASCLESGRFGDRVRADMKSGEANGVQATPTFFINGRQLTGAQPLENFQRLIDDELARKK